MLIRNRLYFTMSRDTKSKVRTFQTYDIAPSVVYVDIDKHDSVVSGNYLQDTR